MDNPWANAWDESKPRAVTEQAPAITTSWTVTSPSITLNHDDHEADITAPSWSAEPSLQWSGSDAETVVWNHEHAPTTIWEPVPSVYAGIQLGKVPPLDLEISLPPEPSETYDTSDLSPPSTPTDEVDVRVAHSILTAPEVPKSPSSHSSTSTSASPEPDSPDAFGTFETAGDMSVAAVGGWTGPDKLTDLSSVGGWETSWGSPDSTTEVDGGSRNVDEWESAKQRKEKQDKHVPPELLESILLQLEELSNHLWPESQPVSSSTNPDRRHVNFESLGLDLIQERLIPDQLTLPAPVSFSQSFTAKQLAEALRLTRHAMLPKKSPMAMYMSSKGSTSWEASVKARPELSHQDLTPAGWKIVEKEEPSPIDENKKKPALGSGILSFFGRKSTNPIVDEASRRSASPVRPSGLPNKAANGSPRASIDSAQSITPSSTQAIGSSSISSPTGSTFTAHSAHKAQEASISSPTFVDSADPSSDATKDITPPPSAVSRFLGRFSRSSKSSSSPSPQGSMSLSNDDLEFLSDVVPTAHDHAERDFQLDALSSMIKSPPLPATLPPPLAPPPRPTLSKPPSHTYARANSTKPPIGKHQDEDLFSFFNSPPLPEKPASPLVKAMQPLPTISGPDRNSAPISNTPLFGNSMMTPTTYSPGGTVSFPPPPSTQNDDIWSSFHTLSDTASIHAPTPPPKQITAAQKSTAGSRPPLLNGSPHAQMTYQPAASTSSFLPPPPSSRSHTPFSAAIPNAPSARSKSPQSFPTPRQSNIQQPVIDNGDDDDFSDFLSSPAQPTPPPFPTFNSLGPTKPTVPLGSSGTLLFGDFNDFGIPPISTPSPPRPPAKSLYLTQNSTTSGMSIVPSRATSSPQKLTQSPPRVTRVADHQRTLSLLETAASRGGKWLGPPSPLPDALPPPGPPAVLPKPPPGMQAQQVQAVSRLQTSSPSPFAASGGPPVAWTFPAPPSTSQLRSVSQPQNNGSKGFLPAQSVLRPSTLSSTTTPPPTKTGGLSAQDLSFFEGL